MDTNPNFSPIESTPPLWVGDYLSHDTVMRVPVKLDVAQFNAVDAVKVIASANAAQNATSVAVAALSGAIPNGTVLDFGGAKFARLTAAAAAAATVLTVAALPTAIAQNDTATFRGIGKKSIPSGTFIGRTIAERDAGTAWGPVDIGDDEQYLTTRDVADAARDNTTEIYRHNKTVKENYLPGWATLAANLKARVRALYACIGGTN